MTERRFLFCIATFAITAVLAGACGAGDDTSAPPATTSTTIAGAAAPPPATATLAPTATPTPDVPVTYVVQPGDNPTAIAESLGVPVTDMDAWVTALLALNDTEATPLQVGQELALPPFGAASAEPAASGGQQAPDATEAPTSTAAATRATTTATGQPTVTPNPAASTPLATATEPVTTAIPTAVTPASTATLDHLIECATFTTQATRDWCSSPGGDALNCTDFLAMSGEATLFTLIIDPSDIHGLDGDGDGRSCDD